MFHRTYGIFMGFLHGKLVYNQDIYGIFMGFCMGNGYIIRIFMGYLWDISEVNCPAW
jgi:hypothetical protein